jgi:hypothetical protein
MSASHVSETTTKRLTETIASAMGRPAIQQNTVPKQI